MGRPVAGSSSGLMCVAAGVAEAGVVEGVAVAVGVGRPVVEDLLSGRGGIVVALSEWPFDGDVLVRLRNG